MVRDEQYKKAEQKILAARDSGATHLNLSGMHLTELPETLGQLTNLRRLNLSGNQFTELPEFLNQLAQLSTLDVSGNQLTELRESLFQLTQLRGLDVSGNHLTELQESLGQLTQLRGLNVSSNGLTKLPVSLNQFTQLRSLNLFENQLTGLPESLGLFTQLRVLNANRNQLTTLPESLGHLTHLQGLDLSDNRLEALPESLGQLLQLRRLNLSGNELKALPESVGQLAQLRALYLSINELLNLPDSVGQLTQLKDLYLQSNQLTTLPESLGQLKRLRELNLHCNQFSVLPEWLGSLTQLEKLTLGDAGGGNPLGNLPICLSSLKKLRELWVSHCDLDSIPAWINKFPALKRLEARLNRLTYLPSELGHLKQLEWIGVSSNNLRDFPASLADIDSLSTIFADANPLNPELAAAHQQGADAIKRYLRAKAESQIILNEGKLILIGEGEVGKSCLLGALRGDPWEEDRPTTHGIEIKPFTVTDSTTHSEITLNGWDFGGQRVYRPTHQLFFSAPAVYLVVWKPREGSQQGLVKEWIKLVKHREPDARILVVATHGGPGARQPDIDRQEIWDIFGKETVIDFFHVDSRPLKLSKKKRGAGKGIERLKQAIARVAAGLSEMGRTFPKNWQEARNALRTCDEAYLPLEKVFEICRNYKVEEGDARLLLRICRHVGDLIHFEHDPMLRDIVVIKPDWLATAISLVLDDEHTRDRGYGLVSFSRLGRLWNDPKRKKEERYPPMLHHVFVRLMERFDLSYRVADQDRRGDDGTSLIAQLVPDLRPDSIAAWGVAPAGGDTQQVQICRIVDSVKNQSAAAEGLFYQLIVRLHKYSLGRADYEKSVHWQRGLVLEDDTGARAFLEHIVNDVRITVRSPYPERFLAALTYDVKWLVESFWEGLRCEVTVPCLTKKNNGTVCMGLFDVAKLIENKGRGRDEQPCPVCNEWHGIELLLHNAPASSPDPISELISKSEEMHEQLEVIRRQLGTQQVEIIGRFDRVDATGKEIVSKVEAAYSGLMHALLDEAKEGPRLFSFEPVEPGFFDRPNWMSTKLRLSLWCEHSRTPLWKLMGDRNAGVYTIDVPRDWLVKAAPFLKILSTTLGLVLPVVASSAKVLLAEEDYKGIERQLELGKTTAESLLKGSVKATEWMAKDDGFESGIGGEIRADGATLRQLQTWLKVKDPSFGGLVRVLNKRQEFLWVHPGFEGEY